MSEWYYGKEGQQNGPLDESAMKARVAGGEIGQSDLVWKEGMAEWLPLSQVAELSAGAAPSSTAAAPPEESPYVSPASNPMAAAPQGGTPVALPTSGLAIASLVLGILAILSSCVYVGVLFGIPAVICGHMAIKKLNAPERADAGKGMALAGLICGYLGILFSIMMIAYVIFMFKEIMPEMEKAIEEVQKAQNAAESSPPIESYEEGQ